MIVTCVCCWVADWGWELLAAAAVLARLSWAQLMWQAAFNWSVYAIAGMVRDEHHCNWWTGESVK